MINAWWSALGSPVCHDRLTFSSAWNDLTWSERALLFGARWSISLLPHSVAVPREVDPRYDEVKQEPGCWNRASSLFSLPEAVFQSITSLSFTAPFSYGQLLPVPEHADVIYGLAVGFLVLSSAGDSCRFAALRNASASARQDYIATESWRIVRHPK